MRCTTANVWKGESIAKVRFIFLSTNIYVHGHQHRSHNTLPAHACACRVTTTMGAASTAIQSYALSSPASLEDLQTAIGWRCCYALVSLAEHTSLDLASLMTVRHLGLVDDRPSLQTTYIPQLGCAIVREGGKHGRFRQHSQPIYISTCDMHVLVSWHACGGRWENEPVDRIPVFMNVCHQLALRSPPAQKQSIKHVSLQQTNKQTKNKQTNKQTNKESLGTTSHIYEQTWIMQPVRVDILPTTPIYTRIEIIARATYHLILHFTSEPPNSRKYFPETQGYKIMDCSEVQCLPHSFYSQQH